MSATVVRESMRYVPFAELKPGDYFVVGDVGSVGSQACLFQRLHDTDRGSHIYWDVECCAPKTPPKDMLVVRVTNVTVRWSQ